MLMWSSDFIDPTDSFRPSFMDLCVMRKCLHLFDCVCSCARRVTTGILKHCDCSHCFLQSLVLRGLYPAYATSIFILLLDPRVISVLRILIVFFVCMLHPPDHKLKGTLPEGKSRQQLRCSTERITLLGYRAREDVCGEKNEGEGR